MQPRLRLSLLLCVTMLSCQDRATVKEPPHDEQHVGPPLDALVGEVRSVCHVMDYDERQEQERQHLIGMGEKVFPAYEAILNDPKSDPLEVSGVLGMLFDVKADRSRFLKYSLSRLTDADGRVRMAAAGLLKRVGSSADASAVVPLLSDDDVVVIHYAAETLAAIGDLKEQMAMDKWLRGGNHRDFPELREHVQKCRDELKKRLAAKKDSSK